MGAWRKFVALLLTGCLVIMGVPAVAFADEGGLLPDSKSNTTTTSDEKERVESGSAEETNAPDGEGSVGDKKASDETLDVPSEGADGSYEGEEKSGSQGGTEENQENDDFAVQENEEAAESLSDLGSLAAAKMQSLTLGNIFIVREGVVQSGLPAGLKFDAGTNTLTLTNYVNTASLQCSGAPLTIKLVGKNSLGRISPSESLVLGGSGSLSSGALTMDADKTTLTINSGKYEIGFVDLSGANTVFNLKGGTLLINAKLDTNASGYSSWTGLSGAYNLGAGSTFNLSGGTLTVQDLYESSRKYSSGIVNYHGNINIKNCVVKVNLKAQYTCIGVEVGSIDVTKKKVEGGTLTIENATLDISVDTDFAHSLSFFTWNPIGSPAYYAGDSSLSKTTFDKMMKKFNPVGWYDNYRCSNKKAKIVVGSTSTVTKNAFTRLAGTDRYKTMAAILQKGFAKGSADTVIVATGENFPDALAASGLAGLNNAPIVLTSKAALNSDAQSEIKRIGAKKAIVIGSSAAVSTKVENSLKSMGLTTSRIQGATRVETAQEIFKAGKGWSKTAIIASGNGFADALSISSYSYAKKAPLFLTDGNKVLTKSVINTIKAAGFTNIIIVGSDAAVSKKVETQLKGYRITRLGGADRYATSLAIAEFAKKAGLSGNNMAVATGANFPDALSGAALCGRNNAVILLVADNTSARNHARTFIAANKSTIKQGYVLGSNVVVSDSLHAYLNACCS